MTNSDARNLCYNILSSDAHWNVNKHFARQFGIESAVLIADLLSKEKYFFEKNQLIDKQWFFNTQENIENDCCLSPFQQRKIIKLLKEQGFIETKEMGLPCKTYYKVLHDKLSNFFTTCAEEISRQELKKFHNIINNNKDNNNKDNNNKKESLENFEKKIVSASKTKEVPRDNIACASLLARNIKAIATPTILSEKNYKHTVNRWAVKFSPILSRYSVEQVKKTINWCFKDNFWKGQIMSFEDFSKKMDKLYALSNKTTEPTTTKKPANFLQASDELMESMFRRQEEAHKKSLE